MLFDFCKEIYVKLFIIFGEYYDYCISAQNFSY